MMAMRLVWAYTICAISVYSDTWMQLRKYVTGIFYFLSGHTTQVVRACGFCRSFFLIKSHTVDSRTRIHCLRRQYNNPNTWSTLLPLVNSGKCSTVGSVFSKTREGSLREITVRFCTTNDLKIMCWLVKYSVPSATGNLVDTSVECSIKSERVEKWESWSQRVEDSELKIESWR